MPARSLSREVVLRRALELADRDGLDALTMRRLGTALGVEAMALYHHVGSKQALLEGLVEMVLDETLDETQPAAPDADPREVLRGWAREFRAAAQRHPEVIRLFATQSTATPAWRTAVEAMLAALRGAGVPDETAVHAYRLVATFATGYVLWELRQREQPSLDAYLRQLDPAKHPATHLLAPALRSVDRDAEYELGVDLMLAALDSSV